MSKTQLWQRVFILVLLIFPSLAYVLLSLGDEVFDQLPIYGARQTVTEMVNGKEKTDTVYHTIPEFSYLDQEGKPFTRTDLGKKISVTDFIFTNCRTICPKMSAALVQVQHEFRNEEGVQLVSFTVDPENDSIPVLADYAKKLEANPKQWRFLYGDQKETHQLATKGFLVLVDEGDVPGDFFHSEKLILTDTLGRIRGYYDGTSTADVIKLKGDVKALLIERFHFKKEQREKGLSHGG